MKSYQTAVTQILFLFTICFSFSLPDLVTDMDFSPFDESLLATCSVDETVSSSVSSFFLTLICSLFPFLLLCVDLALSCCSIFTLKSTSRPLRVCFSWQGFKCDMNLLGFCNSNRLETPSSQHIILIHRCAGLLESAECGSASLVSAVWFTTDTCVNTHNYCYTHPKVVCTYWAL